MGVCKSKSRPISQKRTFSENQTPIKPMLRSNRSQSRPKTMPDLQPFIKEATSTGRALTKVYKPKKKITNDALAKTYSVLSHLRRADLCGQVQHNLTGQVRSIRPISKTDEKISNIDEYIQSISENSYTSSYIANVIEIYQDAKSYYLIQEFCNGGLLKPLCGNLLEEDAVFIVSQILAALEEIHQQNGAHGQLTIESFALLDESQNYCVKLFEILPIFQPKKTQQLKQLQLQDIKQAGLILFQLITNKPILPNTPEMILKKPRDLPCKTEWYQFCMFLLQAQSIEIYQQLKYNNWYNRIVTRKIAAFTQTLIKKTSKKPNYLQSRILIIMNQLFFKERCSYIEQIFNSYDQNKNGTLSRMELKQALKDEGGAEEVDGLFDVLDTDGNGEIDINEFLYHTSDLNALITDTNLQVVFNQLQRKGSVTAPSINQKLESDEDKLEEDMPSSCKNKLNYDEFRKIMMSLL